MLSTFGEIFAREINDMVCPYRAHHVQFLRAMRGNKPYSIMAHVVQWVIMKTRAVMRLINNLESTASNICALAPEGGERPPPTTC